MKVYNYRPSLTTRQQMAYLYVYHKTGCLEYKTKIAMSYLSCISKIANDFNFADKEDVISEILMIVYNAIDKYDPENPRKASIYTYLYRVISTKMIDKWRYNNVRERHKSDIPIEEAIEITEQSHMHVDNNDYNTINQRIHKLLSPLQAKIIERKLIKEEPIVKITKELKISRAKYDDNLNIAMEKLQNDKILKELKEML